MRRDGRVFLVISTQAGGSRHYTARINQALSFQSSARRGAASNAARVGGNRRNVALK